MFKKARIKLTAWYLIIIMVISLFFSITIYSGANNEFRRFERIQQRYQERIEQYDLIPPPPTRNTPRLTAEEIQESRMRFLTTLGFINLLILVFSGFAGYFLAGRTLKPIKKMMDEQNRFITDASHELRTPLTSLRTEIEVNMRNKKLSNSDYQKILQSNLEEVVSLQALSDNLLELSKKGSFIRKQDMQSVSLKEIIKSAVKKVESLARNKDIIIENTVKDIKIQGIQDRLTEAIIIFLDNAIKYSPNNSKIVVTSQKEGKSAVIEIADHGIGIAEKELPYIFDRFYRANRTGSKAGVQKIHGYGLGLSIAKRIIEAHRGSINVKSKVQKGTTITLTLPTTVSV